MVKAPKQVTKDPKRQEHGKNNLKENAQKKIIVAAVVLTPH